MGNVSPLRSMVRHQAGSRANLTHVPHHDGKCLRCRKEAKCTYCRKCRGTVHKENRIVRNAKLTGERFEVDFSDAPLFKFYGAVRNYEMASIVMRRKRA